MATETRARLAAKLTQLVHRYSEINQPDSALFWAGHLVALTEEDDEDEHVQARLLFSQTLLTAGHPRRAAAALKTVLQAEHGAWQPRLRARHLAAKALRLAGQHEDALETLDEAADLVITAKEELKSVNEDDEDSLWQLRRVRNRSRPRSPASHSGFSF